MTRAWHEDEEILEAYRALNEPVDHKKLRALGGTITEDEIVNSDLYKELERWANRWFPKED